MAVLKPLKVECWIITQQTSGKSSKSPTFRRDPECTTSRATALWRELYIEQEDFMEVPPPKYSLGAGQRSTLDECLLHHLY